MEAGLLARYQRGVPRYTSYPTAPHFHPGVDADVYTKWLRALPRRAPLSLYIHVPFCDSLCWFCGCHTKVVRRYGPVASYLKVLRREICLVAQALGTRRPVAHLHFGGGSPTILEAGDVTALMGLLGDRFSLSAKSEVALEIDPRDADRTLIDAWARSGVTRASLGVQDFNPEVQRAVNRIQSFARTAQTVEWLRSAGVERINIDLMYGLPHQTVPGVLRTVEQVIPLKPDRLALFGYAHVPWLKRHQRLIPDDALPGAVERSEQSQAAAARLVEAGYVRIGLDHFARPDDPLAKSQAAARLHRNFQGYTTDTSETLIGLGASAIGSLPRGYVQNAVPLRDYVNAIDGGRLAVVRGVEIDADDRLRRAVIERLMCDLRVDLGTIGAGSAQEPHRFTNELSALAEMERDGIVVVEGARIRVTERGRPFVRSVCAVFDRYLEPGSARHSRAI